MVLFYHMAPVGHLSSCPFSVTHQGDGGGGLSERFPVLRSLDPSFSFIQCFSFDPKLE